MDLPSRPRVPELLLPAGSFESALAAIEGGADALYLGFSEFSARKAARNFSRLEYRRLYHVARGKGISLYVTLNTIILQRELEAVSRLLAFLGRFPPDAIIIQDWGLARLIRDRHPGIAIHASTQTASQGSAGALIAHELGASRIVLPRETSLSEMRRLQTEAPGIEFEAFVHGALCYSFSGLCLASGIVLGRSGNRGECAQLCRSYYDSYGSTDEADGLPGRRGYWFSCRDLDLSGRVGELAAAGISSLKVEGRMKSPEYCFAVAALYRGLLDRLSAIDVSGKPLAGPSDDDLAARREAARVAFARSPTEGWVSERGGSSMIDAAYPGHRGVAAGRIESNDCGRLVVVLSGDICIRDGLLGFERGDPSRPVRFPVLELRDADSARGITRARAGSRVRMLALADQRLCEELRPGDELRRISSRDLDRRRASPEECEPAKEELSIRLRFGDSGLAADLALPCFAQRAEASSGDRPTANIEAEGRISMDLAKAVGGLERALSLFKESGDADFRLVPDFDRKARVDLISGTEGQSRSCLAEELFIPPSVLKREKNRLYARAAELVAESELAYARRSAAMSEETRLPPAARARPPRAALVFPREGLPSGMPFATPRDLAEEKRLPFWGERYWLPLSPLVVDREDYAILVEKTVTVLLETGSSIALGLGALHHFAVARRLLLLFPEMGGRLAFFLDFNLYVASDLAYASLAALATGIEFAYLYLEQETTGGANLAPIGPNFAPPLFQSLACLYKHHVAGGVCPNGCDKTWSVLLADREREYRVIVEDCVTMLFRFDRDRQGPN